MSYVLARNAAAYQLWFEFLTTKMLDRASKRKLLAQGFTPPQLLEPHGTWPFDGAELRASLRVSKSRQVASLKPLLSCHLLHWGRQSSGSDLYPPLLSGLSDAPLALFVSGDINCLSRPAIAVVGTRRPSRDGLKLADQMGYQLAAAGFLVVSGLARGIDAAAHRGALRSGGQTLAVMATGMDRIYPSEHYRLAEEVAAQGALLSEFCPGVVPHRGHFPRRNRTLSGLCLATVVIEAGHPSGSLITANAAVEQGREVFAAPWSLFHRGGAGCLRLLSQGAQLIDTPAAVIEHLGVHLSGWAELTSDALDYSSNASETTPLAPLEPAKRQLLTLLGDGEHDLASLASALQCSSRQLLAMVTQLELQGYVEQTSAGLRAVRHP